jgi:hypothetical protein
MRVMLTAGAFELVEAELAATNVPTNIPQSMQLTAMRALSHALVAAADRRLADVARRRCSPLVDTPTHGPRRTRTLTCGQARTVGMHAVSSAGRRSREKE